MTYNKEEWIGKRFGNLTVTAITHGNNRWDWRCRCDCGRETVCNPYKVIHGKTTSCGCKKKERCAELTEKYRVKHGGRHERLYAIWHGMKQRCYDPNHKDYASWGGRGIGICDSWRENYAIFRDWAASHGYKDNLTIDRIDVNGNYSPDNCRWVSIVEQARNKRNNLLIEIDGVTKPLSEWCEIYGLKYGTVYSRIKNHGWEAKTAILGKADS